MTIKQSGIKLISGMFDIVLEPQCQNNKVSGPAAGSTVRNIDPYLCQ